MEQLYVGLRAPLRELALEELHCSKVLFYIYKSIIRPFIDNCNRVWFSACKYHLGILKNSYFDLVVSLARCLFSRCSFGRYSFAKINPLSHSSEILLIVYVILESPCVVVELLNCLHVYYLPLTYDLNYLCPRHLAYLHVA